MALFLLSYLGIYGIAHAYLAWRMVRAFQLAAPYPALFIVVSIFMILAPILVRILEHGGMLLPASLVARLGYLWMGFFFLLLSASIALDLIRGILAAAGWIWPHELLFTNQRALSVAILLALVASCYGLFEARNIKVEQVTVKSAKIPESAGRVRIVQISDVHLGLMLGKGRLKRILDQVAALKPDLIFSTGDLVDGQRNGLGGLDTELFALQAPLGKYGVLGNHEIYAGLASSSQFTEHSGFRMLRQQYQSPTDFLTVAGVDDPATGEGETGASETALLATLPRDKYTILLKHRPTVEPGSLGLFDLQLSGHVHKGQIFPFNLITHLFYPAKMGLSEIGAGSLLYVSRGSGTWGPPMRVLAPPEVTVIDLFPSVQ